MEDKIVEHVKMQIYKSALHALKDFILLQQLLAYYALLKDVPTVETNSIVYNANLGTLCQDQVRHLSA